MYIYIYNTYIFIFIGTIFGMKLIGLLGGVRHFTAFSKIRL